MQRIALKALFDDRSKLGASVAGVAFAAILVLVQLGLYAGFLDTSSSMIAHMGGDVWVMPRGTEVLDSVETLSPASRALAEGNPCVVRARPLVFTHAYVRKTNGTHDSIRLIGTQRPGADDAAAPMLPWELASGLPSDLQAPMRVAIDEHDVKKLHIEGQPVGTRLEIGGHTVEVAAVSRGIRSFTLMPYVFADIEDARQMSGMKDGEVNYWVLDLKDPSCTADVIRSVERHPELQALDRREFMARTQSYWVGGSGAGAVLAFSALLGLIVGIVVVGQTLYTMTKEYQRELATLKALGATNGELVGFVGWQAGFLAVVGVAVGTGAAIGVARLAAGAGLRIVLAPWVFGLGIVTIALMCAAASAMSVRRVVKLQAAEVFQ